MSLARVDLVVPEPGESPAVRWRQLGSDWQAKGARRVAIVLPDPLIQIRRIGSMPHVSRARLKAIVSQQPLRYFRPGAAPLVTDARWTKDESGRTALLVAADSAVLATAIESLEAAGLTVEAIWPTGVDRLDLLPPPIRQGRWSSSIRSSIRLGIAAVGGWAAVLALAGRRLDRRAAAIERDLTTQRPAAQAMAEARLEVERTDRAVRALDSAASFRGRLTLGLAALGQRLPHRDHFATVVLRSDSVWLRGFTVSPASLVQALARDSSLLAPTLLPPTVGGGGRGGPPGMVAFEVNAARRDAP